jgi:hypothetical protein
MHVDQSGSGARSSEPVSATETALLEIWQRLFRLPAIGIHDDFFELGGHSLLATRLIASVRSVLGERLLFSEITEHRTIARLSARIDQGRLAQGRLAQGRDVKGE